MKGNSTFIIGGARSGKSGYALELGSNIPGRKGFIATAEAFDEEMKERITLHQKTRSSEWASEWETIEEPVDIAKRLLEIAGLYDVVIVDCLTLWLSNMLCREEDSEHIKTEIGHLTSVLREITCKVIIVSNEVGLGIVPENRMARLFRDLGGWMNQKVASASDEVYLVTCGIPMKIKG